MKAFVISLKRSIDRRERIEQQLRAVGIPFEFFDAIDGSIDNFTYSDRARPAITKKRKGYSLKTNEIACFASHYSIWEKCLSLNKAIIVIEDNVDPAIDAKAIIELCFKQIEQYNYIKLSATHKSNFYPIKSIISDYKLGSYQKGTCGTTAYILTPKAARYFIRNATSFLEPVDDYMEKPWRHHVQTYSVQPNLFSRANIASTIGAKRKKKIGITAFNKIYIELYRIYESLMKSLYWKNK